MGQRIDIKYVTADMSDMSSVKNAAEFLKTNVPDIFISNAGAYRINRTETRDGMDPLYQINCFAPHCLIKSILPEMRRRGGKVVAVSSISQMMIKIDPNDATGTKIKNEEKSYANSKRVFTLSLFEAFKTENNVKLSVVHPGICFTNLMANYPKIISKIIEYPMKLIFMTPHKASLSIAEGIFTECDSYEWIGPRFFGIWGSPKKTKIKKPSAGELNTVKSILQNRI